MKTTFVYQDESGFFLLFGQKSSKIWWNWAFRRQNRCLEAPFLLPVARTDAKTGKNTGVLLV
jgi:hypothetical protein